MPSILALKLSVVTTCLNLNKYNSLILISVVWSNVMVIEFIISPSTKTILLALARDACRCNTPLATEVGPNPPEAALGCPN